MAAPAAAEAHAGGWEDYPSCLLRPDGAAPSALRDAAFPQLRGAAHYCDHAGAAPYSAGQVRAFSASLLRAGAVIGNPHSRTGTGRRRRRDDVDVIRGRVLSFFGVTPATHSVIFNSGATAGLKTVGESFCFRAAAANAEDTPGRPTTFMHTTECHTSLLGIREYARAAGARVRAVDMDALRDAILASADPHAIDGNPSHASSVRPGCRGLLGFPAECNFSGRRVGLDLVVAARRRGWAVLLDASKFAATTPLNLRDVPADFVVVSFYKIFGFPTGLGALIVRNESVRSQLARTYFGGGTLLAASVASSASSSAAAATASPAEDLGMFRRLAEPPSQRFEDGTIDFLSLRALPDGFDLLRAMGLARISRHTAGLARTLAARLSDLRHANGRPVCCVYGHSTTRRGCSDGGGGGGGGGDGGGDGTSAHVGYDAQQGSIVAFNVLHPSGEHVGYAHVASAAAARRVQLRVGCFCNPGACQVHLGISAAQARANYEAGHVCSDDVDMVDGRPTGAVRVSFGHVSTVLDVDAVVDLLQSHFVDGPQAAWAATWPGAAAAAAVPAKVGMTETSPCSGESKAKAKADRGAVRAGSVLPTSSTASRAATVHHVATVHSLHVYPIKSCAGVSLSDPGQRWALGPSGLQFDREWAVVVPVSSSSSPSTTEVWRVLRQKDCPRLALVQTRLSTSRTHPDHSFAGSSGEELLVTAPGEPEELRLPLARSPGSRGDGDTGTGGHATAATVVDLVNCGRRCSSLSRNDLFGPTGNDVADRWFSRVLQRACRLVRVPPSRAPLRGKGRGDVGFSNEKQLLLINSASVRDLQDKLRAYRSATGLAAPMVSALSFRPNIVVSGMPAFAEDAWLTGSVQEQCVDATGASGAAGAASGAAEADGRVDTKTGAVVGSGCRLEVSTSCIRCSMVNHDPASGKPIPDVLRVLSGYRRAGGTVRFGRYLAVAGPAGCGVTSLTVGQALAFANDAYKV